MEEEDFEENIKPQIDLVPEKKFDLIIQESGVEKELANEFHINFYEHFRMASEWAKKAKKIIVTNENQVVEMEQARTARLFLRAKRLEIENFRVEKKEYYLKAGRAIDKVANFLKDTIIPTEEHLARQEHFVKLKKEAEDARLLAEARVREEARIAEEAKKDAEERERLRVENEKLRKDAEERKRINDEELKRVQEEAGKVLQAEREKSRKAEEELRIKNQEEMKAEAKIILEQERLSKAGDQELMIAFKLQVLAIQFPQVKSEINKTILGQAKGFLALAVKDIQLQEEI